MDGTGAGDGLHGADTGLGDCRGGGAHEEGCGGSGEGGKAFDGEVFVEGRDFVDVVADLLFFFIYSISMSSKSGYQVIGGGIPSGQKAKPTALHRHLCRHQ